MGRKELIAAGETHMRREVQGPPLPESGSQGDRVTEAGQSQCLSNSGSKQGLLPTGNLHAKYGDAPLHVNIFTTR